MDSLTQNSSQHTKTAQNTTGFYNCLDALLKSIQPTSEPIFLNLRRGQVGLLVSATNVGKSTLALNLGLKLSAGESFPPLQNEPAKPLRVMYLDFESDRGELRDYIGEMLANITNEQTALSNFIPVVDAEITGEALNLSKAPHRNHIKKLASESKIDLMIIDNLSAAFSLKDENSNAEMTDKLIRPLKKLTQEVACAVLLIHHSGKPSEGSRGGSEAAYSGRGASALGCLARVVFTLTRDNSKGANYVVLNCAKSKGKKFPLTALFLNNQTRWFEVCDDVPTNPMTKTLSAHDVAEFIQSRGEVHKRELYAHFKDFSSRTIDARAKDAAGLGLIHNPSKKGAPWHAAPAEIASK